MVAPTSLSTAPTAPALLPPRPGPTRGAAARTAPTRTAPTRAASGEPVQAPGHVVMVRPHRFAVNPATAGDNAFQRAHTSDHHTSATATAAAAYADATRLARALRDAGVSVALFEDETGLSPDSVFCNNWFTTHPDGRVLLCPMFATNRRRERRPDVLAHLQEQFHLTEVLDWTAAEDHGQFLEGTGSV